MGYHRYRLLSRSAPNVVVHPHRFKVHVDRLALASLLVREFIHYRGDLRLVLDRPCVYGVFSGPIGGFAPRERLCVGCLRCTVQYPEVVQVVPNPERLTLGDSYFDPDKVDTILYEAATGHIPVRGAGYRGAFGGPGWDGMWTDMSEIVRPTRDGIHGREYISTEVDLGSKPRFLVFGDRGEVIGERPAVVSLPVPILFDPLPASAASPVLYQALTQAAIAIQTLAIVPLEWVQKSNLDPTRLGLIVKANETAELEALQTAPRLIELEGWEPRVWAMLQRRWPEAVLGVRCPFGEDVAPMIDQGVSLFHLTADFHGRANGRFALEAIREVHERLIERGIREQVTLIGSGGITAAEHVPKAIIVGLDAVAIDTATLVALQARMIGEAVDHGSAVFELPPLDPNWAAQRLINLVASWRDQLLEVLGAMGMREVRRLRGEVGRAIFQAEAERESFGMIVGFEG